MNKRDLAVMAETTLSGLLLRILNTTWKGEKKTLRQIWDGVRIVKPDIPKQSVAVALLRLANSNQIQRQELSLAGMSMYYYSAMPQVCLLAEGRCHDST